MSRTESAAREAATPSRTHRTAPDGAARLAAYLDGGLNAVEGWLDPFSARIAAALGAAQTERGVTGALGEIGVHHGRLFILLHLLAVAGEKSFAVDVFADQDANVDRSGRADEGVFLANLDRHAGARERLEIFACDSNSLTAEAVSARTGPARLVSVDGGHTAETTESDLRLVDALLLEGGIAILDDYFNPHWPDVSVGAARYFLTGAPALKPFLVTPGKVFLVKGDAAPYREAVQKGFAWRRVKDQVMFGAPIGIYGFEPDGTADRLKQRLAAGPLGDYIRPGYRALRRILGR